MYLCLSLTSHLPRPIITMRFLILLLHVVGTTVASGSFQAAVDEIVAFHRQDTAALAHTLDSLSTIATRLQSEPDNPKYRKIRLLNKTFWERVGSVDGGIAFMSSLGFDLLGQGELFLPFVTGR